MSQHDPYAAWRAGLGLTGDLPRDAEAYLRAHGCPHTAEHSAAVAAECRHLAVRYGLDPARAERCGWLHDISAVIPTPERLAAARALGLCILPAEARAPMLLHQKLSAALARGLFEVTDEGALQAIGCHTTLRAGSTALDQLLFVADKLAWDQPGEPPYGAVVLAGLEDSLAAASLAYLRYLWAQRETLPAVHPWMVAALRELGGGCTDL